MATAIAIAMAIAMVMGSVLSYSSQVKLIQVSVILILVKSNKLSITYSPTIK